MILFTGFKHNISASDNGIIDPDPTESQAYKSRSNITADNLIVNHIINDTSDSLSHWHAADDTIDTSNITIKSSGMVYGIVLSVFVGFCSSSALLIVSETDLKNKEGALVPLLWQYSSGSLIVGTLMLIQYYANLAEPLNLGMSLTDAILITIHVTSLVAVNWLMITALYYCDAFLSGLCRNTDLVFMAVASWTILWGLVPAHRNILEVLGVILILVASFTAIVSKYLNVRKVKTEEKN